MRRMARESIEHGLGRILSDSEYKQAYAFHAIMEAAGEVHDAALAAMVYSLTPTKKPTVAWRKLKARHVAELRGLLRVLRAAGPNIPRR